MKASISNIDNKNINMVMGCYGIGVSRIAAAAIEQSNDDRGIIWPKSISPFDISIISIGYSKNEKIKKYTNDLYEILKNKGVDVLMDDRDISPGNMFSDSDLIGIPFKIIVGKQFLEKHTIEFKERIHNKTYVIQEDPTTPSKKTINNILKLIQN